MTDSADDAVAIGIAAWARLRDHERATWADWLDVARALAIGRTAALKIADTNRPLGTRYNMAMGVWLRENGLDGVVAQERYRLLLILQNIEAIEIWRADLDEAQRRGLSHPNSVWANWRRHTADSARSTPAVRHHIVRTQGDAKPQERSPDLFRAGRLAARGDGATPDPQQRHLRVGPRGARGRDQNRDRPDRTARGSAAARGVMMQKPPGVPGGSKHSRASALDIVQLTPLCSGSACPCQVLTMPAKASRCMPFRWQSNSSAHRGSIHKIFPRHRRRSSRHRWKNSDGSHVRCSAPEQRGARWVPLQKKRSVL